MLNATPESAAERVYREVKGQILTNEIAGGELISEGDVASRCAVSRTPVRE
ncbi:GntR family transcriptional regulator, partial [Streptomyces sp. SID10244]|nr:GntR family transcriptional regulator [Streptomyces sp. SID10244]